MSEFRSPPPPLAPPPSRETDVVFGVLLLLTGILVLCFFGYLLVRVPRKDPKASADDSATSTTYSASEQPYTEDTDTAFKLKMNIPQAVLRPLKL